MDFTTQAAIVSALLALLVLLGGLALRDRRRRNAEPEQESEADAARADWIAQLVDHGEPVEHLGVDPEVEVHDIEQPAEQPTYEQPAYDGLPAEEPMFDEAPAEEPVLVDEVAEEPVLDEQPVLDEPAAPRGWWARRRARRRARRLEKELAELEAPEAAEEAHELSVDEQLEELEAQLVDEQAVDIEATVEDMALVQASLSDAADQLAEEQPDGSESESQAELRALRAQVRTLEEAVAQLAERQTGLAVVPAPAAEPTDAYLRQISLVVRGLAEHTDEAENPHRTLARVAAAVERLGVPNGMDRPVLPLPSDPPPHPRATGPWRPMHRREIHELEAPAGATQGEVVAFPGAVGTLVEELVNVYSHGEVQVSPQVAEVAPQPEPDLAPQADLQVAPQVEAMPEPEPEPELMPEPTQAMELPEAEPTLPTYDAAEVVLPVPPPAQNQPQTTRRRFRR